MSSLKDHLIQAVAAAAAIGLGTTVVSNKIDVTRHDERIHRIEAVGEDIDGLRQDLRRTETKLERLDAKLEAEEQR